MKPETKLKFYETIGLLILSASDIAKLVRALSVDDIEERVQELLDNKQLEQPMSRIKAQEILDTIEKERMVAF